MPPDFFEVASGVRSTKDAFCSIGAPQFPHDPSSREMPDLHCGHWYRGDIGGDATAPLLSDGHDGSSMSVCMRKRASRKGELADELLNALAGPYRAWFRPTIGGEANVVKEKAAGHRRA